MRHLFYYTLAAAAFAAASFSGAVPSFAAETLVYNVKHQRYGNIGTYTNEVEKTGDTTTVNTKVRIRVSVLGVTLYRQEADREERWDGDRLASFRGVTTIDGQRIELNGEAEGDRFLLDSPKGPVVAPASVRLANPWAANFLKSEMVITPDRGNLEKVSVKEAGPESVNVEGRNVAANKYDVHQDGRVRYEVWLDAEQTPVQFRVHNRNGIVTFTLDGDSYRPAA